MIGAADVHKAIVAAWNASDLDATFKALWDSGVTASEFPVLHDQEAGQGQPFPYAILEQTSSNTTDRMSGGVASLREVRDITVTFHVHARKISGNSKTAKRHTADLAEEIMKVFGGHPTTSPTGTLSLDNGNHLTTLYVNDYGVRTGDDEYQWTIDYTVRIDVPLAA